MEENNETALPTKVGFWGKFKAFLFQEINVEFTSRNYMARG